MEIEMKPVADLMEDAFLDIVRLRQVSMPSEPKIKTQMDKERYAQQWGGIRALETYRLDTFMPSSVTQSAFDFCKAFDAAHDNLYLCGPCGSGKSHLAVGTARRFNGNVWKTTEISRFLRKQESANDEETAIASIAKESVLVIDDIGIEKPTEYMIISLQEIFDMRYQYMPGGLIVTSNLSLDGLAARLCDDHIPSRLAGMCKVFNLKGEPDHRIKK